MGGISRSDRQHSSVLSTLTLGCLLVAGCSAPPAPLASAPSSSKASTSAAPTPAASQSAVPAPDAPASAPAAPSVSAPSRPVWTTPKSSNVCTEYARAPLYAQIYYTREECEKWVRERGCQPGYRCFDGCNWGGCMPGGDAMTSTSMMCWVAFTSDIHFEPGTSKLSRQPDWKFLVTQIQGAFRAPERHLLVLGYTEPSEVDNVAAQGQLAQQRAQVVLKELTKRGLPAKRIVAKVGDAEQLPPMGEEADLYRVHFEFDPGERVRNDYEPASLEYQEFCGVKPRRGE